MKVLKFGGSSVGNAEKIKGVMDIILKTRQKGEPLAVVVSAFQGVTDKLINMAELAAAGNGGYKDILKDVEEQSVGIAKELILENSEAALQELDLRFNELKAALSGIFLINDLTPKTLDFVMGLGERISAFVISRAISGRGVSAAYLDSRELIKTDDNFGSARVLFSETDTNIRNYFASVSKDIFIITGFIGSTLDNKTATLGRGGSDYTASIFGAALGADIIEIWTDVDGVLTADPRKVKKAFSIYDMTYDEAMEMSHFGAKVIYPPVIQPALDKNISLVIKNTFNPDFCGTIISKKMSANGFLIKGISSISDISLLRAQGSGMIGIAGIASRLFGALAKQNINVILITQASSEHSICFAVNPKEAARAKQAIDQEFALEMQAGQMDKAAVEENLSIVAAVGENMKQSPGVAGKVFQALGASGVNVVAIAQGSSELNISAVIYKEDESRALNVLHDSFFISAMKPLNIFLAGTGLIGGTLLKQIRRQAPILKQESGLDINLAALADIDRMIFNSNGVFADWKKDPGGEKTDLPLFIKKMKEAALPNSVFVDCTASEAVADFYEEILSAGISIATPNKKANSGQYEKYARLKNAAKKRGVKFLYETNVGAGLPVISVLNNLVKSGDKILKIEAVLSGTLSFIFNSFRGDKKFSEAVREAKESGYTEPDPRDDLSGLDAARKILILAREAGFSLEMKDIEIQDIIPPGCKNAKDVNDFFSELEKEDGYFEELKRKAENSGKVLRCIARLENGKAGIFLEEVDFSHPFYSLSGSDNIISFTTEYYKNAPLVVKGPGAGAEVTAAGVFADILSV